MRKISCFIGIILFLFVFKSILFSEIIAYRNEKGVLVITNKPSKLKREIIIPKRNINTFKELVDRISRKYNVPSSLVHQIIQVESNYNPNAISPKGAIGLMQLMPETAKRYGVENPFDPAQNIEGGVKYLIDLIKLYKGNTDLILAAYNAGQEAVKKYGGIPPYSETIKYIEKVKKGYNKNYITMKLKIYKYYDQQGRLVISNQPPLPGKYKGKIEVIK